MSRIAQIVLIIALVVSCILGQEPVRPEPAPPDPIIYKGTERSTVWFEAQYAKFRNKIAFTDRHWVGVGLLFLQLALEVPSDVPEAGTELRRRPDSGRISQILNATQMIVRHNGGPLDWTGKGTRYVSGLVLTPFRTLPGRASAGPEQAVYVDAFFHVTDVDTKCLVDGAAWVSGSAGAGTSSSEWLVYCGTHRYLDTAGTVRTIPSYRPHRAATRLEFAEALRSGLELIEWTEVKKAVRPPKGSKEKPRIETSLAAKPVP